MLFYLLTAEELTDLLDRLGYGFDPSTIPATVDHYLARTCHGSTLSRVAHAWVLARTDRARSWQLLTRVAAGRPGRHPGRHDPGGHPPRRHGRRVDILQRCYTGLEARGDVLGSTRLLPDELRSLELRLLLPQPARHRARRPPHPAPERRTGTRRPDHGGPPRRPPPTHRRHGHPIRTPSAPSTRPPTRPRPVTQPRLEHRPDSWRVRSSPGSTRAVRAPRRHEPTEIRSTQPRADRRDRWGPTSPSRDQRGRAPEPRRPRTTAPTERANTSSRSRPDGPVSRTEPPVRGSSTPAVTERRPARYQDRAATVSRTPPRR